MDVLSPVCEMLKRRDAGRDLEVVLTLKLSIRDCRQSRLICKCLHSGGVVTWGFREYGVDAQDHGQCASVYLSDGW